MSSSTQRRVAVEGVVNKLSEMDMSYRYKMELADVHMTAHHLVVDNMAAIAADLCVDPKWIVKYLSVECGARCTFKKADGAAYLSVGHASNRDAGNRAAQVQRLIRQFIDMFVICPRSGCMNPEWSLYVSSDGLASHCPACGATLPCPGRDHKVGTMVKKALLAARKANRRRGGKRKGGRGRGRGGGRGKGATEVGGKEAWRSEAVVAATNEESKDDSGCKPSSNRKKSSKASKAAKKNKAESGGGGTKGMDDPEFASLVASLATVKTQLGGDDDWWSSDDDEA